MPTSSPRRRVSGACSFCRRRKIKCNGVRPTCGNCQTYREDCAYEPVDEHSKETGRRRHAYKQHRAQRVTGSRRSQASGVTVDDNSARADEPQRDNPPVEAGVARILVSANGVSTYHSRTSTLYEDNVPEKISDADGVRRPQVPDEWVERALVAEAAKQRQLEDLNFRQGKLDFDGVDPDLGMHLLSIHWNRQHHSFLVTYRPAFMRDMACAGPYFSKLLLNAIYFGASKFSPRLDVRKDANDVRTAGWTFRSRVRELLGSALDASSITTIQALLQMTNSLFALGDERSAAWLYAGLAFRMLTDLGMHVDVSKTGRFSDEDLEIRRRVFWGAFVVDKMQSLYQGRPVSLKEADAVVPIKFLDTYEELEHWRPFAYSSLTPDYPGSPAYSVSTFAALCKLALPMSDILSSIYTERSVDQTSADLASTLDKLQHKLDEWKAGLPDQVQCNLNDPQSLSNLPPPHVFSLHAMYNVLIILLHRPFVADGHLYNTSRSILVDSLMKCASAASDICSLLRAYDRAFSIRHAPYLISYATYVAATILVRIAAKRHSDSSVYRNLATCLAVFKENQETNFAVQKASMVIRNLMNRLGVVIDPAPLAASGLISEVRSPERVRQSNYHELPVIRPTSPGPTESDDPVPSTSGPSNADVNGISPPFNPDWVDIDGIIQSFLQEGDNSAFRPPPQMDYSADQGQSDFVAPGNTGNISQEAAFIETPWSQAGAGAQVDSFVSVDDPLFGFNGSVPFAMNGSFL